MQYPHAHNLQMKPDPKTGMPRPGLGQNSPAQDLQSGAVCANLAGLRQKCQGTDAGNLRQVTCRPGGKKVIFRWFTFLEFQKVIHRKMTFKFVFGDSHFSRTEKQTDTKTTQKIY